MGIPSSNVQYHPPRLSEDRLNLPQPHSPSLPTHCSGNRECAVKRQAHSTVRRMKFLVDAQLPRRIVYRLRDLGTTRFTPSTLNAATRRQTRLCAPSPIATIGSRDEGPGRLPCEQVGTHKVLIRLGAQCLDFGSQRFRDTAQLVLGRFSLAVRFTANLRDVLFGQAPSLGRLARGVQKLAG